MKVQISVEKYLEVIKSGVKVAKIIGLQWDKSESKPHYYKNYKTWGWTSESPKLYVFYEKDGKIEKKNVLDFVLKTMNWKRLSDKRVEAVRKFLVGKELTVNSLMLK